jgi:CxxC-x17-CxxC domain-containing protein
MSDINFFAETTFRNKLRKFGIKLDDRRRHMYVIGKTGMGKTVAIKNMAIQDIQSGHGIGFVDPHGEAAEELLDYIPSSRVNDVIYFNPADLEFPIAFNIMESIDPEHRHLVASGLMGVFKKIWPDVWSARMEYILNNCILALLEYPGATLLGVNRMLADPEYRKKVVDKITDPVVKSFWVNEFAKYTQRYETEATAAIQNKIGQFISAPLIRNIIGQVKSTIDMREIMDKGKILIMDLSKGRIGEDNSRLLGALLITKIQLAAMSRVDIPEEQRKDFFLYVDEFQNFATESFTNILSEARKYRLDLTLGHQYITQMEETVRDAVFGNVGTLVSFRVGAEDAEFLEREFSPEFLAGDLVNLPKYNIYLKLMIDGISGSAFSARTLPPLPMLDVSNREKIIKVSRERYGTPRDIINEKISRWTGAMDAKEAPSPQKQQFSPQQSQQTLYDAQCKSCGRWTKVIFPPDGTRPVYCKSCLKKIKQERSEQPPLKVEPVLRTEPVPVKTEPILSKPEPASLKEAIEKETVSFSSKIDKPKPKRKEVNLEELKRTLEESLGDLPEKPKDAKPQESQPKE